MYNVHDKNNNLLRASWKTLQAEKHTMLAEAVSKGLRESNWNSCVKGWRIGWIRANRSAAAELPAMQAQAVMLPACCLAADIGIPTGVLLHDSACLCNDIDNIPWAHAYCSWTQR